MTEVSHARRAAYRVAVIRRRVRWTIYVLLIVSVAYFVYEYDVQRIPDHYHHLAPQKMPAGSRVVMTDYDEDTVVGLGTVLLYEPPAEGDYRCFGVVAGLPGERLELVEHGSGRAKVRIGDRLETLELPEGHALEDGVIPGGHYLILNGDRHLFSGKMQPDSRVFGYIPESRLRAKVVTPLYFFQ